MKLYAQLCTLLYLEQSITPNSQIKDRLLSLLNAYPHTITRQMGFPLGWEKELLWQKNRYNSEVGEDGKEASSPKTGQRGEPKRIKLPSELVEMK